MDFYSAFPYIVIILTVIICRLSRRRSPRVLGRMGERTVARHLRGLSADGYQLFNNVLIRTGEGEDTAQIDHIAVGHAGVFVIETKNYRGPVSGEERDAEWMSGDIPFRNPLHQNWGHVQALRRLLPDVGGKVFRSYVLFPDDTDFSDVLSFKVLSMSEMRAEIRCDRTEVLSEEEVRRISDAIRAADISSLKENRAHIRRIRKRIRHEERCRRRFVCPDCGAKLEVFRRDGRKHGNCPVCGYTTFRRK